MRIGIGGVLIALLSAFSWKTEERVCIFKSAHLNYEQGNFYFHFQEISGFYEIFQVKVNGMTTMKVNHLKRISSFPIGSLNYDENNEILVSFDQKTYAFYLFPKRKIGLLESGFSFNDLIDDRENIIEFQDSQYFIMRDYEEEVRNAFPYYDFQNLPAFSFDARYILGEKIEMVLYSDGLFPSLNGEDGYHFLLSAVKGENAYSFAYRGVDPIYHPEAGEEFQRSELCFGLFHQAKRADVRVEIDGLYGSPINLFFTQTVDLSSPLFGKEGVYAIRISDSEKDDYVWEFDL